MSTKPRRRNLSSIAKSGWCKVLRRFLRSTGVANRFSVPDRSSTGLICIVNSHFLLKWFRCPWSLYPQSVRVGSPHSEHILYGLPVRARRSLISVWGVAASVPFRWWYGYPEYCSDKPSESAWPFRPQEYQSLHCLRSELLSSPAYHRSRTSSKVHRLLLTEHGW